MGNGIHVNFGLFSLFPFGVNVEVNNLQQEPNDVQGFISRLFLMIATLVLVAIILY
jgi:hypothetical protein